ncbi:MAG: hypothetical protein AAF449_20025, partial [Myxococcota bacterium]
MSSAQTCRRAPRRTLHSTVGHPTSAALVIFGLTNACGPSPTTGGVTAHLEFAARAPGPKSTMQGTPRALRTARVPEFIERLQVLALDVDGSTLAETNLFINPGPGQLQLFPQGGTWTLNRVSAGTDRRLVGRGYFGPRADPRLDNALVYSGQLDGITVVAGQTTNAGLLTLRAGPNRIPEADFEPPPPPAMPMVIPRAVGEQLDVSWSAPDVDDVDGYVVAVGLADQINAPPPSIERGTSVAPGMVLDGGYTIAATVDGPPQDTLLTDLPDGTTITVLIYAFDTDVSGEPLNFSDAAIVFETPRDTAPPAAPGMLTLMRTGTNNAQIQFESPGEDGEGSEGAVARYEIRTAASADALLDPSDYASQLPIAAPDVVAPGETVTAVASLLSLGVRIDQPRYIGVRAVDAADNAGPAAVASLTVTSTEPPAIFSVAPRI